MILNSLNEYQWKLRLKVPSDNQMVTTWQILKVVVVEIIYNQTQRNVITSLLSWRAKPIGHIWMRIEWLFMNG